MSKTLNMTEGKPSKLILAFAFPLMLGNLFQQLYTLVDGAVVGRYLGVIALAALGECDWLYWMALGMVQGFTQGFSIQMAQDYGAQKYDKVRKSVAHSLTLSLVLSIILVIIFEVFAEPVMVMIHTPAESLPLAMAYLRIVFAAIPIVMFYNNFAGILRALGDSKTPLNAMIVASFSNIALDILFVLVFKMGIRGAAFATTLAQLISSVYCLYFILKIDFLNPVRFEIPDLKSMRHLIGLGTPMAFQNMIISMGGMFIQSVVNNFGVIFIAGMTATNKIYGLLEIAAVSYGFAMVTYAGQNLGAGKTERIKEGVKTANIIGVITSVGICAIMLLLGKFILGMFISGTPEEVEQALGVGYRYLSVMSISLPILYVLHVVRSTIQGMGNTTLPMFSGFAELTARTLSALFLPVLLGPEGIFFAEVLAWIGADCVLIPSYFYMIKKSNSFE